jgi:DNA-binding CsgD family transcriptional regulator
MHTHERRLVDAAHEARSPADLRSRALAILMQGLEADLGVFVAREGRTETRTLRGLGDESERSLDRTWATTRHELLPVKVHACREGAATDRRVLGPSLETTTLFRSVMAPIGGTETLVLVLEAARTPIGLVALGRRGSRFSDATLAHARTLVPVLSLACRAVARTVEVLPALTDAEDEMIRYLELGLSTAEIARARGRSFFTVRNQMAALYRKLEVANRAEALGRVRRM